MESKSNEQLDLFEKNMSSFQREELDTEYFELFSWALPTAFSDPLGLCQFEAGDTIYDTKKAYLSPWSEALNFVKYCIHVTYPPRVFRTEAVETDDTTFENNWRSPLEIDLYTFENHKIKSKEHINITQGKLYSFLWKGDFQLLKDETHPDAPIKGKSLTNILKKELSDIISEVMKSSKHYIEFKDKLIEKFKTNYNFYMAMLVDIRINPILNSILKTNKELYNSYCPNIQDFPSKKKFIEECLSEYNLSIKLMQKKLSSELKSKFKFSEGFVILFDKTNSVLTGKYSSIINNLREQTKSQFTTLFSRLDNVTTKEFAPTLQVVCFLIESEKKSALYETIKKSVYKPVKGRITSKDQFEIKAHGIYLE